MHKIRKAFRSLDNSCLVKRQASFNLTCLETSNEKFGKNGSTLADLKELLTSNPEHVERFVMENVGLETLEKWMEKKAEMEGIPFKLTSGKNKLSKWKVR